MSIPINALTPAQPVQNASPATAVNQKASVAKPLTGLGDTVTISSSAKAILQEVTETRSQTVLEANGGDSQARRLLARETAANPAQKG
jgi:hypothetical protein